MRAVFDTNVLVAAFATEGLCGTLLRRARKGELQLLLSPGILQEFQRVLRGRFAAAPEEIRKLELHTFRGIRIVRPRDFEALFTD